MNWIIGIILFILLLRFFMGSLKSFIYIGDALEHLLNFLKKVLLYPWIIRPFNFQTLKWLLLSYTDEQLDVLEKRGFSKIEKYEINYRDGYKSVRLFLGILKLDSISFHFSEEEIKRCENITTMDKDVLSLYATQKKVEKIIEPRCSKLTYEIYALSNSEKRLKVLKNQMLKKGLIFIRRQNNFEIYEDAQLRVEIYDYNKSTFTVVLFRSSLL
ncbi:hypothetical protein [Runella sp.]|uniref:hypothetical protein n=1 Tax=Runella sp. TaxID=1960881 RepID=UPI0030185BCB